MRLLRWSWVLIALWGLTRTAARCWPEVGPVDGSVVWAAFSVVWLGNFIAALRAESGQISAELQALKTAEYEKWIGGDE